jgi:3-oxoacyl-[acyl-carrier-protein] synthase II
LTQKGYGSLFSNREHLFDEAETFRTTDRGALFCRSVKNYGRLDDVSRMNLVAVSLALRDAGIVASPENKQNIGIVGASTAGSLTTDREYFDDYLANGRKLSRANLFIYTLPSSSLGESAIHFGLTGPLFYLASLQDSLTQAALMSVDILAESGANLMLAGELFDDGAIYLLIGDGNGTAFPPVNMVLSSIEGGGCVEHIVERLKMTLRGLL